MSKKEKRKKANKTNMDLIEQKLAEVGSGTFFKAKEGKNKVRILPPWNDEGLFYHEQVYHYGLKHDGKNVTVAGPNPIVMKFIKKMEEQGSEDAKAAKKLQPKTKYYVNILERTSNKVMIWGFSRKVLGTILSAMADPDYGDITDLEEGYDVTIERAGTGLDTKYEVRVRPKQSEAEIDLDKLHMLDEIVEDFSDKEVKSMLKETFEEADDDDDDDEPKKKKKRKDDDDDDDDDDDGEEDDDDEEEEEDDDDEEDEKSKKKKKKKAKSSKKSSKKSKKDKKKKKKKGRK